jgi:cytochrome c oxidase assembly protein subunit 15
MGGYLRQVTLGIATLLTYVPPSLGTAHQAGALTLLTLALCLLHTLRRGPAAAGAAAGKLHAGLAAGQWRDPAAAAAIIAVGTAVTQLS